MWQVPVQVHRTCNSCSFSWVCSVVLSLRGPRSLQPFESSISNGGDFWRATSCHSLPLCCYEALGVEELTWPKACPWGFSLREYETQTWYLAILALPHSTPKFQTQRNSKPQNKMMCFTLKPQTDSHEQTEQNWSTGLTFLLFGDAQHAGWGVLGSDAFFWISVSTSQMHIHQDQREHIASSRFNVLHPYPIVFNDFLYKNGHKSTPFWQWDFSGPWRQCWLLVVESEADA